MYIKQQHDVAEQDLFRRVRFHKTIHNASLIVPRDVEYLVHQQEKLTESLKQLYLRTQHGQNKQDWSIKELQDGVPRTHRILERLGILKDERHERDSVVAAGD
jgi:hypothetical protein